MKIGDKVRFLSEVGGGKVVGFRGKDIALVEDADGFEITNGTNYPSFPIVPLWANDSHQSSIVGIREQIDCYDLIKSGFANTVTGCTVLGVL